MNHGLQERITYGVEDAHRQLGITRSALYQLMSSGEVASIKVGKRRLITRRALEAFIERQEKLQGVRA